MIVYEMYGSCGGKHSFYVGQANQDVSLVLDARQRSQPEMFGVERVCIGLEMI